MLISCTALGKLLTVRVPLRAHFDLAVESGERDGGEGRGSGRNGESGREGEREGKKGQGWFQLN